MTINSEETDKNLLDIINNSRFFGFFLVGMYIGVTVVSTTDEMLIKQSQVKLPLLDVQIPVASHFGFHNIAPWLIVMLHGGLLLELGLLGLGKKLQCFKASITPWSFQAIELIIFRTMLILILIFVPLSILLLIQGRFLVLHDELITWVQRAAIGVDIILLWLLWPGIEQDYEYLEAQRIHQGWKRVSNQWFLLVIAVCSVALMTLMTIPDEQKPEQHWLWSYLSKESSLKSLVTWWFQWRNLDLHEKVLVTTPLDPQLIENLRNQDIDEKKLQKIPTNFFQGINMTHANLIQAVLPRIDFRAAHGKYPTQLQDADLRYAKMPGALSDKANLQRANLQGAWLLKIELREANLTEATLQAADLQGANLQGTNLQGANLQGANLQGANLQGANLLLLCQINT